MTLFLSMCHGTNVQVGFCTIWVPGWTNHARIYLDYSFRKYSPSWCPVLSPLLWEICDTSSCILRQRMGEVVRFSYYLQRSSSITHFCWLGFTSQRFRRHHHSHQITLFFVCLFLFLFITLPIVKSRWFAMLVFPFDFQDSEELMLPWLSQKETWTEEQVSHSRR